MQSNRITCAIALAAMSVLGLASGWAGGQVIVDGQETGVVINAQRPVRSAPVHRSYASEYNPQTRARIVTKESVRRDSQIAPRIVQLTYGEESRARVVTRDSMYNQGQRASITVHNDSFRVDPYYARRYYEYVPYYNTRRNYSNYSYYGGWYPWYWGHRSYYRTPYYGGYGYHGGHRGHDGGCGGWGSSSSYRYSSGSGFHFFVRF